MHLIKFTLSENNFIPRVRAIKFLQVTPAEFRKLCILKGIFPRMPPRQYAGLQSYYFKKDITQLAKDPVAQTLRSLHTYHKKHQKFTYLKDKHSLKFLELSKPDYDMKRLVAERYPTPDAAIADIDDCLCLLSLFAQFSSEHSHLSEKCLKLMTQFQTYVAATQSLRKCFISTKGFYFQAIINNQLITWCEPHKFNLQVPQEVEMDVLKTFVEFYSEMLKAVLIYLFQQVQLSYPLQIQDGLQPAVLGMKEHLKQFNFKQTSLQQQVFKNQVYKINREVPQEQLQFLVLCGGGEVGDNCTHLLADRQVAKVAGIDIVQPQFCFDSFNLGVLLPVYEYEPGAQMPPHLSPFQFDFT